MPHVREFSLTPAGSARAGAVSLVWLDLSSTPVAIVRKATRASHHAAGTAQRFRGWAQGSNRSCQASRRTL